MFKQLQPWLLGAFALGLCQCAGTETDNPLIDFEASECKAGSALTLPSGVMRTEALTLDASEYDGLHCFAWELRDGGALKIDVLNYSAGCHIEWEPAQALVDGDQLTLGVRNKACAVAGCGNCIYDFSFEVTGVDPSRPLELTFQDDDCHTVETAAELTLPIDERSEGIVCRQRPFYLGLELWCGGAHQPPCRFDGMPSCETDACDEDASLQCVAGADDDDYPFCLETCTQDDDCALDVDACEDGLCQLRETF